MDPRFLRLLLIYRREQLIAEGKLKDSLEFDAHLEAVEKFLENPDDGDLVQQLDFNSDVMQTAPRVAELQCWIEKQVS